MPKPDISRNLRQLKALDMLRCLSSVANLLKNSLFCGNSGFVPFFSSDYLLLYHGENPILLHLNRMRVTRVLYPNAICPSQNVRWKERYKKLTSPRLQLLHPGNRKHGLCNGSSIFSVGGRTAAGLHCQRTQAWSTYLWIAVLMLLDVTRVFNSDDHDLLMI